MSDKNPSSISFPPDTLEAALKHIHELEAELAKLRNIQARAGKRFQSVVDKTPAGICITNDQGMYEYVNPAYCQLYGYTEDELLGRHFTKVVAENNREHLNDLHEKFIQGQGEVRGEWTVLSKSGQKITILADACLLRQDNGALQKATFIQNITERRQMEELRERVEQITRHDLKTPLNAVINLPDILLEDANLTAEHRELLGLIRDAGYRMLETINLSHDLFRMETKTYQLNATCLDIMPLLLRVLRELQSLSSCKSLRVQIKNDTPDSFLVLGEDLLCYSLLANLVKNAMEAAPCDSVITFQFWTEDKIKMKKEQVSDLPGACISIHNQGAVPVAIRDTFFEKYTTQGKQGGMGLGTYSARLITETLGGTIEMHSSEKQGTTITVCLPR
jgi:PAS domain S-box-containing protein